MMKYRNAALMLIPVLLMVVGCETTGPKTTTGALDGGA